MSGCNSRQPHHSECRISNAECGISGRDLWFSFRNPHSELRTRKGRAPACAAESPKLSLPGAAPGRLANFHFWGSWHTSNALALQASLYGGGTHRLHQPSPEGCRAVAKRRRATRSHVILPASSYGAASQSWEVFRPPACKSGVEKECRK
jgi:hypothetical protein